MTLIFINQFKVKLRQNDDDGGILVKIEALSIRNVYLIVCVELSFVFVNTNRR